jgi:adenylosuccinate synthase
MERRTPVAVVGLGFGDEGKGATVDFLCRHLGATRVGRYSGGCQAAHWVHTPEGKRHAFSQFSSGTFAGARTELSQGVYVSLEVLLREAENLDGRTDPLAELTARWPKEVFRLISIDPNCRLVTPWHGEVGRQKEVDSGHSIGTTGWGIGEAVRDYQENPVLTLRSLREEGSYDALKRVWERLLRTRPERKECANLFEVGSLYLDLAGRLDARSTDWASNPPDIIEGSQGTLLDPTVGWYPYITKTPVTAMALQHVPNLWGLGVTRAYMTRHGNGPLPTENPELHYLREGEDNIWNEWQGAFRVGNLDLGLLRYSIKRNGGHIKGLAVTCLDKIKYPYNVCTTHIPGHPLNGSPVERTDGSPTLKTLTEARPLYQTAHNEDQLLTLIETHLGVPICIASYGKTWRDRKVVRGLPCE